MTEIDELRRGLREIATEVEPVDLHGRALATSHRIRVRRTAVASVAGVAVAAMALGTAFAAQGDHSPTPPGATTTPGVPSPTALPTAPEDDGPDLGPFTSATITVPSWGSAGDATGCVTGRVTLSDGQYYREGAAGSAVNVLSYVATDVDHDGDEDYVAHLMCGEGPESDGSQIVAFRRSSQELKVIGRVIGTQDGLAMMDYLEARAGGQVAVLVSKEYTDSGQNTVPNQWRTYAWQGGRFRQVAGPTAFPARPPAAVLSVAASELRFRPAGNGFTGGTTVTVRNDGDLDVARLEILLIVPSQAKPTGEGWAGCVISSDDGDGSTAYTCTVAGPRAHSQVSRPFAFVATEQPTPVEDELGRTNHDVSISQVPPFDGLVTFAKLEAVIPMPN